MDDSENDDGQDQQESQREMRQEHEHVEIVLERLAGTPLEPTKKGNAGEVSRIRAQGRHQTENRVEQEPEAWTDSPNIFHAGWGGLWSVFSAHISQCSKEEPKQVATQKAIPPNRAASIRLG